MPVSLTPEQKSRLKEIIGEAKRLQKALQPIELIAGLKDSAADALEQLQAAAKKIPAAETTATAISELKENATKFVAEVDRTVVEQFRRAEAQFINEARSSGRTPRQVGEGWRVGPLEFVMKRPQAQVTARYNGEPLLPARTIASMEDLQALETDALASLEKSAMPEEELERVFWRAYRSAIADLAEGNHEAKRVPIRDFYVWVRLHHVGEELRAGKPDREVKRTTMPRWAFLYNLDRYRKLDGVDSSRRLWLDQGAQAEIGRGMGMVTNGLDSRNEYKMICYVAQTLEQNP
jgi:hypothetical protein